MPSRKNAKKLCNFGKMFKNIYTFAPKGLQYLLHT